MTTPKLIIKRHLQSNWSRLPEDADSNAHRLIDSLDAAGFVVVPKEPTDAMRMAACEQSYDGGLWESDVVIVYRAMIAAASPGNQDTSHE